MIQKYFSLDKNYILKTAQADSQERLLAWMINLVKFTYIHDHNPLGLEDDIIKRIKASTGNHQESLENFYQELSGIYRYKFSDVQLEILFDGRSHYDKYLQDWENSFKTLVYDFCSYSNFLKAVLEGAVLFPETKTIMLVQARMKYFLSKYFEVKVYKYKGIQEIKIA